MRKTWLRTKIKARRTRKKRRKRKARRTRSNSLSF
jgi:hypothetical protein